MNSGFRSFRKYKRSGEFYRNSKKNANCIKYPTKAGIHKYFKTTVIAEANISRINENQIELPPIINNNLIITSFPDDYNNLMPLEYEHLMLNDEDTLTYYACDSDEDDDDSSFANKIKEWAMSFNISHSAIKQLSAVYNVCLKKNNLTELPVDPRTLLSTCRESVTINNMKNGLYWHNGLKHCLETYYQNLANPISINLNINIDGLPVFKSSRMQLWPILFTINGIDDFNPMVIGIFCGGKPDPCEYLQPFVNEFLSLTNGALHINGNRVDITIRCFICDAPARSMIKGTVNFNAYHGCHKCHIIGEYDRNGHHMSFPRTDVRRRTNNEFREKIDSDHHKFDSALLPLPIDMVKDIIVCDMLHQLHVGIMKRQLLLYTGQLRNNKKFDKWDCKKMNTINNCLSKCTMPTDINRAVRPLDCVAFWKASEFRTFLHYLGPVILRDNINNESYTHFLSLFCAITICSSPKYLMYLEAAEVMLVNYIEVYISLYGEDSISSNLHNLCHLTEEVSRFGALPSFSTYPFENKLFQIKKLLRNGSRPLHQVAKRLGEYNSLFVYNPEKNIKHYPIVTSHTYAISNLISNGKFYKKINIHESLCLSNDNANKWFLTYNNEIVGLKYVVVVDDKILILGNSVKSKYDFFTDPMRSSSLNIFISNGDTNSESIFTIDQVRSKFVCVPYDNNNILKYVYIPLMHTIK